MAVQVFGKKPKYSTQAMVPVDFVEAETMKILAEVWENLPSKPDDVQQKILEGKLMKILGEDVLECQYLGFEESNLKVGEYLQKQSKDLGLAGNINVKDWYSF